MSFAGHSQSPFAAGLQSPFFALMDGCFPDAEQTPTNVATVSGATGSPCTDSNGTYSTSRSYNSGLNEWTWSIDGGFTAVLRIKCDRNTGVVGAQIADIVFRESWNGPPLVFTNYKQITTLSVNGGNLVGTFTLEGTSFCVGQSVTVTLAP